MISYEIYKMVHYLGIFLTLTALAGTAFAAPGADAGPHPWRRTAAIGHGVGLLLVLLGGFGMLARLSLTGGLPGWIYAKLALWLILGALPVLVRRRRHLARPVWGATILVAWAAGYLALYKPL